MDVKPQRLFGGMLGAGLSTGIIAGFAAGLIDALWSWGPAAQFVPGVLGRVRFVLYSGLALAAAGAVAGLIVVRTVVAFARNTRLGDLLRFGWRVHEERRARDPRDAIIGL